MVGIVGAAQGHQSSSHPVRPGGPELALFQLWGMQFCRIGLHSEHGKQKRTKARSQEAEEKENCLASNQAAFGSSGNNIGCPTLPPLLAEGGCPIQAFF